MHSAITIPEPSDDDLVLAAFGTSPGDRERLTAALTHDRPRTRVLALRGLLRHGAVTDAQWADALSDDDVDVRREALTLVAQVRPDDAVIELVVGLVRDPDPLVVDGAAFALGEFEWAPAVEPLCRVARDHEDARCREAALAALGAIGDDAARATILSALEDKPAVRRRAIVALANFEGPDIDAALERASDDRDWQVRAAVSQLGRIVDED